MPQDCAWPSATFAADWFENSATSDARGCGQSQALWWLRGLVWPIRRRNRSRNGAIVWMEYSYAEFQRLNAFETFVLFAAVCFHIHAVSLHKIVMHRYMMLLYRKLSFVLSHLCIIFVRFPFGRCNCACVNCIIFACCIFLPLHYVTKNNKMQMISWQIMLERL